MANEALQAALAKKKQEEEKAKQAPAQPKTTQDTADKAPEVEGEKNPATTQDTPEPTFEEVDESKDSYQVFQFPITPCTYRFRGERERTPGWYYQD